MWRVWREREAVFEIETDTIYNCLCYICALGIVGRYSNYTLTYRGRTILTVSTLDYGECQRCGGKFTLYEAIYGDNREVLCHSCLSELERRVISRCYPVLIYPRQS